MNDILIIAVDIDYNIYLINNLKELRGRKFKTVYIIEPISEEDYNNFVASALMDLK